MSDMKLSEQLQEDHDCGDFGRALEGYAKRAKALEDRVEELESYFDKVWSIMSKDGKTSEGEAITEKETKLLQALICEASDGISNRSCNDWRFPDDWTNEERGKLLEEYCAWNGEPENYPDECDFKIFTDWAMLNFLSSKLA